MSWSLYEGDKFLSPKVFSNGKSQKNVVDEVIELAKEGKKIIFIHGVCGTGKSAIALNIAKKLGRASVVVPGKNLQMQYKKDYEENKYILKDNNEKLKISVITGRNNHKCKFLEDNKTAIPNFTKEVNQRLHDIFAKKRDEIKETIGKDVSADNNNIPCKIEIREKNWQRIRQYLQENKDVNSKDFDNIKDVKRVSVAGVCPYWCPVIPDKYELGAKSFANCKQKKYLGLDNTNFIFYKRKPGCSFYEQFNSFIESDVIVFNSMKYKLESLLNRKPLTEVEIVDECDEFLDSFSNQRSVHVDRLQSALIYAISESENADEVISEIGEIVKQIKKNNRINDAFYSQEIIPLRETGVYDLFRIILNSGNFLEGVDDESYLFDVEETARMFKDFLNETFITVDKKDDKLVLSLVTTNLAKKFKEMTDKNKVIVLMSGTLHSKSVLKNIFGLEEFEVVEAETSQQGQIEVKKTCLEMDCKYSNFSCGKFTREDYLKALDACIESAVKPCLVHVNAFIDLPTGEEKERFELKNLKSRNELIEIQNEDKEGKLIENFKNGNKEVLFSTRASRGIDFPGDECKSIVFTKYPNPNVKDAFWRILMKNKPEYYWDFYRDKARRELWQKVYRGLRFKEDHVYVLSPDTRVLEEFS
ncbi:MAG: DEAD/DEAH box helicase family protein [Candidatus Pacearchaeota archaeon]|nr:DEAD/DEAH box helicase family protein [Candidatus Pacearchaeota archaeon]